MDLYEVGRWRVTKKMINIYDDDEDDEEHDDNVAHASRVAKKKGEGTKPHICTSAAWGIPLGTSATTTAQSASLQLSKLKV